MERATGPGRHRIDVNTGWVPNDGADGEGWPIEALPYGVGSHAGTRSGLVVAISDRILKLAEVVETGLFRGVVDDPTAVLAAARLNPLLDAGPQAWRAVRARLIELLSDPGHRAMVEPHLVASGDVTLRLPFAVADFVDFYSSKEHAERLGRLFRPDDEPLLPNWRHLPVAYHGRAGTVMVSPTSIRRPRGQVVGDDGAVRYTPSARLDYELELGFVLGNPSVVGTPVGTDAVADHVFGVTLVNDWSARDIQSFEYRPLGPFLGKSFATTISPWILPIAALDGARLAGPVQDPTPLPHLCPVEDWALDLDLEVGLTTAGADEAVVARVNASGLYWTVAQQLAHLTANGASIRSGDLIATGTVSGPGDDECGSLIEAGANGARPVPVGETTRTFLEDGDTVTLRGSATIGTTRIPLGEVTGRVQAADGG